VEGLVLKQKKNPKGNRGQKNAHEETNTGVLKFPYPAKRRKAEKHVHGKRRIMKELNKETNLDH